MFDEVYKYSLRCDGGSNQHQQQIPASACERLGIYGLRQSLQLQDFANQLRQQKIILNPVKAQVGIFDRNFALILQLAAAANTNSSEKTN